MCGIWVVVLQSTLSLTACAGCGVFVVGLPVGLPGFVVPRPRPAVSEVAPEASTGGTPEPLLIRCGGRLPSLNTTSAIRFDRELKMTRLPRAMISEDVRPPASPATTG